MATWGRITKKSYDNLTIRFSLRYIVSQTYDKVTMLPITETSYDNLMINLRYNLWQTYDHKFALLTFRNKNKNIKIKQIYCIFTIYFFTLCKKTDQWWRDFPVVRYAVKELMLHSIPHDIEWPTHRYHNAFMTLLTLVRQRALQSWALSLHCSSFAYRLLLIFLPLNNVLLFIIKIL